MRIIKIPICVFGKSLKIDDIIEKVDYVKGEKNDIGDKDDDYVQVIIRSKEEC